MSKHRKTQLDIARDELMSHVVRCDVLQATMDDRHEWLDDTLDYMQDRYPGLNDLQLAQLEMIGRQFIKPVIPHGAGNTASNRPDPIVGTVEEMPAEAEAESAAEEPETVAA